MMPNRRTTESHRGHRRSIARRRESSDERYRALAETLPQIVWTAGPDGGADYYNGRWFEYTGMTLEQTRGWGWAPVLHPDDLQTCIDVWGASVALGTPYEVEYRFKRASDNTYRWHLGRALPIRHADGSIRKWFGTCTDIDDQKRALEAQKRVAEQLAFIVEATDRISLCTSEHDALQTLCDLITPRFADWVTINFMEPDGRIRNVALKHASLEKVRAVAAIRGSYYIDPSVDRGVARVFATGQPVILCERTEDGGRDRFFAEARPWIDDLGLGSLVTVPLVVRGRVIAVLGAHWAQTDRRYGEIDIPFFEQLAKRAALAFDEAIAHDRARANEELTRQILESSEDCIAVLDLLGRVTRVNESGRSRFTIDGSALAVGDDWFDCWNAADEAAARTAFVTATRGKPGKYEGRLRDAGTTSRWWDVIVTPVYDVAGKPLELLAIARDITSQKLHAAALEQSESRYRSMADAMPQIAFTATTDGRLDFVNARWIEYTGLSLAESARGGVGLVAHVDDRAQVNEAWCKALASGDAYGTECRLRRATDGAYRWHLIRAIPLRDDDGRIGRWFGTGIDLEDQKRALTEIARARDEALDAATTKSRFLATMSHEIRTPMSGVIGMTELMLLTTLTEEQREYAKIVRDSGQALLRVINDILDFSKIEAGKLGLEPVEFVVREQISSVAELLSGQFKAKGVALDTAVDPHVPFTVVGDPGRLRQILMNLVGNALKFTPMAGRVRVTVSGIAGQAGHATLRFAVIDSGIGIEPSATARLFEPFSQADGSTTRRFGGTGLGLSICKQLVALMGGTIGVESAPGAGSCFWFTISFLTSAHAPRAATHVKPATGERRAVTRARSERILLVEDNAVNTLLAIRQFGQLGFEIATAANGREAIDELAHARYDIVFMDCHMPEMDGFEATRLIRAREAGTTEHQRIVAMTADAQVEDRHACLAVGMDDYLAKPSSIAGLAAVLERWLPETRSRSADAV